MATPMENVRIKVDLHDLCRTWDDCSSISWYLVDKKSLITVGDLRTDISAKYGSGASEDWDDVQLTLDGCLIPEWANVSILRENDTVRFSSHKAKDADKKSKKTKKKKLDKTKSKKRQHDSALKTEIAEPKKHKHKKRKVDVSPDEERESSHKKKIKTQDKAVVNLLKTVTTTKLDSRPNRPDVRNTVCENKDSGGLTGESSKKSHTSSEWNKTSISRQPVQISRTNSSSSGSSDSDVEVGGLDSVPTKVVSKEPNSSRSRQEKDAQKKASVSRSSLYKESSSDSSDSDVENDERGTTGKSQVISSKVPNKESSHSSSSSDLSSDHSGSKVKTGHEKIQSQEIGNQSTKLGTEQRKEADVLSTDPHATTSSSVGHGDLKADGVLPKVSAEVIGQGNTESKEVQGPKKRRKRTRSRKKNSNTVENHLSAPMTVGRKNVNFSLVDANDKDIVSVSAVHKDWVRSAGSTQRTAVKTSSYSNKYKDDSQLKHIKFGSDEESNKGIIDGSSDKQEKSMDSPAVYKNRASEGNSIMSANHAYHPSVYGDVSTILLGSPNQSSISRPFQNNSQSPRSTVMTSTPAQNDSENHRDDDRTSVVVQRESNWKGEPEMGIQCETNVIKSSSRLLSGAQVFTRTRHKKKGNYSLTKAQALSDQVTNKSFTFENNEEGELVKKQKNVTSDSPQNNGSCGPLVKQPTEQVKDYENMPKLYGPPRVGDKIAYKVLEMSENYCPEVSAFKEAIVTSFDPQSQMVGLKMTANTEKQKSGRFDCVVEDEDSILTNVQTLAETQVNLNSIMETRLVVEDKK